jgi:organic radical activating enzyme
MYPLAPNPIYRSFQGEGHMIGVPMVFVRLAGCSVGCPLCDTDYKKQVTMSADEIARYVRAIGPEIGWVWITGGEPTDHDLTPLVAAIRRSGYRLALATSGVRAVKLGGVYGGFTDRAISSTSFPG